jgi:NDP-sugar pyrophosphorylase family protein
MFLDDVTVLILAGGKGTRLGELTKHTPKPLLPVGKKPFIQLMIENLYQFGFSSIALSLFQKHHEFEKRLSPIFPKLNYIVEPQPLGTGGGILYALSYLTTKSVLVLNGDSLLDINYAEFVANNIKNLDSLTMACNKVYNTNRFGFVDVQDNGLVTNFKEKPLEPQSGYINAGIYLINRTLLQNFRIKPCSFESDLIPVLLQKNSIKAKLYDVRFIDIGIPEDYQKSEALIKEMKNFKIDL